MHRVDNLVNTFEIFNYVFRSCSFYVVGAGASAGLIPMTHEQGAMIYKRFYDYGVFPVNDVLLDEGAKRLLGTILSSNDAMIRELAKRINPGAVRAIAMQLMTPAKNLKKKPYQYIVFNLAKAGSVIFSFNVDSLPTIYCRGHYVLYPHGWLNPKIMQTEFWDQIIDTCIMYNIEPPKLDKPLLPQREPEGITKNKNYKIGKLLFHQMEYLVFIGYSFGFDGNQVDDFETLNFFHFLYKSNPKPVIVIDPFRSIEISEMLKEVYKTNAVYSIPAYWEYLSRAKIILEAGKCMFANDKTLSKRNLYYIYCDLINKEA
jgi:hypothetical protein